MQSLVEISCCKRCKVEYTYPVLNQLRLCPKCMEELFKGQRHFFRG